MLVPLRAAFLRTVSITSWHWLKRTRRCRSSALGGTGLPQFSGRLSR
jgi:hypothetical protein